MEAGILYLKCDTCLAVSEDGFCMKSPSTCTPNITNSPSRCILRSSKDGLPVELSSKQMCLLERCVYSDYGLASPQWRVSIAEACVVWPSSVVPVCCELSRDVIDKLTYVGYEVALA